MGNQKQPDALSYDEVVRQIRAEFAAKEAAMSDHERSAHRIGDKLDALLDLWFDRLGVDAQPDVADWLSENSYIVINAFEDVLGPTIVEERLDSVLRASEIVLSGPPT